MVEGLQTRLDHLGPGFLRLLLGHMAASRHCVCPVAEREGEVLGYAAALTSVSRFYREFVLRKGLHAALIILPRLLRSGNLRIFLQALAYPSAGFPDDPPAELVSIVVSPEARGMGVASSLLRHIAAEMKSRGIERMTIKTGVENAAANEMYRRLQCQFVRTEPFGRDQWANVYVCKFV